MRIILCALCMVLSASAAALANPDQDGVDEFTRRREALSRKFEPVPNLGNPSFPGLSPERVAAIQASPLFQRASRAMTDGRLLADVQELAQSPKRTDLLYAEIAWIIVMFFFRSWLINREMPWYRRALHRLWSSALFFAGASLILPILLLGRTYWDVMKTILNVFFGI